MQNIINIGEGTLVVEKSVEWKKQRHAVLDEHLKTFCINAHKTMDRIFELDKVDNDWFIMNDSNQALPQTVMNIVCSTSTCKPKSNQKELKAEIAMLKEVLK